MQDHAVPSRTPRVLALVAWTLFVSMGCDTTPPDNEDVIPDSTFRVADDLVPRMKALEMPDGTTRPLGAMRDDTGLIAEFVLNELLISSEDEGKVEDLASRYGGSILDRIVLDGAPNLYLVRVEPKAADIERLTQDLKTLVPDARSDLEFSSQAGIDLFAAAAEAGMDPTMDASLNFVMMSSGFGDRTTTEADVTLSGDPRYDPNAFEWPYMNQGSAQDIGVGEAWRLLEASGRISNRVKIAVVDGGFQRNHPDFPESREMAGGGEWNRENPVECTGGMPCLWHGTTVTQSAMGVPGNNAGVAGPAGPVAELMAVQTPGDVFGFFRFLSTIVFDAIVGGPRVVNMSSSADVPAVPGVLLRATLGPILLLIERHPARPLLFSSAGNENRDIDRMRCILRGRICWERTLFVPCELRGTICVGGMDWDSTARYPDSNYGSKQEANSVDIYGPYVVWGGPTPDSPSITRIGGTSYSSPFVAGVAALVWAANPSLGPGEVWNIVRDTAHVGGVGVEGYERRVNAYAAVRAALEPDAGTPAITLTGSGTAPLNREWSVVATVTDFDGVTCPPVYCPLTFDPAPSRTTGNVAFYTFDTPGLKTITVQTETLFGRSASASITVDVVNDPPEVSISQPTADAVFFMGQPVQLLASASDPNEGPGPGPGPVPCRWTSSVASDAAFPHSGCSGEVTFSTLGTRTLTVAATDPEGQEATASVSIRIDPPPSDLPPELMLGAVTPDPAYMGDGYGWDVTLTLPASATDPEGEMPILYTWRATSFEPNSSTVWRSDVLLSGGNTTGTFQWNPSMRNPDRLLGDFNDFGNDCYSGQVVRITVTATDPNGNRSTRTYPDLKIYRCIFN